MQGKWNKGHSGYSSTHRMHLPKTHPPPILIHPIHPRLPQLLLQIPKFSLLFLFECSAGKVCDIVIVLGMSSVFALRGSELAMTRYFRFGE